MGEEYVRRIMVLGSVPSLGPVVMFDDLEDLLKWSEAGTGGDTVFEKSATVAYNGSACLHIKTRATGASTMDEIVASRFVTERPGRRYRMEAVWKYVSDTLPYEVWFEFDVVGSGKIYSVAVIYLPQGDVWFYVDQEGSEVAVPGGSQKLEPSGWHRVMFEIDLANEKYIKLVCDGLEVDMRELGLYAEASALGHYAKVKLRVLTATAAAAEAYFDDVLVLEI